MKVYAPPRAVIAEATESFRIGQIVDLGEGKALSFGQLIDRLASRDLIFIGEVHDNDEHHLIQIQILQALAARWGTLALGMEFFEKPKQESLDRYLRGEIEEEAFLKEVDWNHSWGYSYHFYRPLLLFARQNGLRVLALNAPREIVRKVARNGLAGLEAVERLQIADEIDLDNRAHRDYLLEIYEQHDQGTLKAFNDFYDAQCVWEDTMAQNVAGHFKGKPAKMIVFSGNGHIVQKYGIPDRTARRVPAMMATLMPLPLVSRQTIDRAAADYVWLTRPSPRGHGGSH
ncbi:MAG: ChaN family lipoprotein [Pseudomonadota bacterium]